MCPSYSLFIAEERMYRFECVGKEGVRYVTRSRLEEDIERSREKIRRGTPNPKGAFSIWVEDGEGGERKFRATPLTPKRGAGWCVETHLVVEFGWKDEKAGVVVNEGGETRTISSSFLPLLHGEVPSAPVFDLYKQGVTLMQLRHLWKATLSYGTVDGRPALKLRSTTGKTGRMLRKLMPKWITPKSIEELARKVNESNPVAQREKELRDVVVIGGLAGAERGSENGSCMHGKGYWANLDKHLFPSPQSPDFSSPPPENCGPYTILWENVTDRKLLNGARNLRVFVWPVDMEGEGRVWYVDRIYPAHGALTSAWVRDWAHSVGIEHVNTEYFPTSSLGSYNERAEAQPAMSHALKESVSPDDERLPWLDTFRHCSNLLLTSPALCEEGWNTHETSGRWSGNDSVRCECCGDRIDADDCFMVEGHPYCDAGCAASDGAAECTECGEWGYDYIIDDDGDAICNCCTQ